MPRGGPRANSGGRRPGAGRKPGTAGTPQKRTSKTNDLAQKAAGDGPLPLEVMLKAMRAHDAAGQLDKAAAIARDAAPYVHPRKQAITVEGGEKPVEVRVIRDHDFYGTASRLSAGGA